MTKSNKNPLTGKKIEFHILQSFPATCLNRDENNDPKTAIIGGVTRARVSSQCWKRAIREEMGSAGSKMGIRSKGLKALVVEKALEMGLGRKEIKERLESYIDWLKDDVLAFFSETELNKLVLLLKDTSEESLKELKVLKETEKALLKKKAKKRTEEENEELIRVQGALKEFTEKFGTELSTVDGLDIALFGRMLASSPKLDVSAAASFSHALSTHKVSNEMDFFTALDDLSPSNDESGAAHLGETFFNSATYYRYISLDLGQLWETLKGKEITRAIEIFTKALYQALPSAKKNSLSGACGWEYARVLLREGQGIQSPLSVPVGFDDGYLRGSVGMLDAFLEQKKHMSGSLYGEINSYTLGEGSSTNIDSLIDSLKEYVESIDEN